MAVKNFKLVIEYDGTDFNGWQIQASGRTIQGEIEKALFRMTNRPVRINGSGRTDAGVHALGQVASFRCETRLTAEAFSAGLNSILPDDIVIRSCREVPQQFHARFDAIAKTYHYRIINRDLPPAIGRRYAWFIRKKLDLSAMARALAHTVGTHDFKAFENTGSPRAHTIRTVFNATIDTAEDGREITIRITADGFLRYMVRNIVGTLVDVGFSKLTPEGFAAVQSGKDRNRAGAAAPPHGLFLVSVDYGKTGQSTPMPPLRGD